MKWQNLCKGIDGKILPKLRFIHPALFTDPEDDHIFWMQEYMIRNMVVFTY